MINLAIIYHISGGTGNYVEGANMLLVTKCFAAKYFAAALLLVAKGNFFAFRPEYFQRIHIRHKMSFFAVTRFRHKKKLTN